MEIIIIFQIIIFVALLLYRQSGFTKRRHLQEKIDKIKLSSPTTMCTNCNGSVSEETVFCPACMQITPRVKEMLDARPEKQPHEFIASPYDRYHNYECPNCKSNGFTPDPSLVRTPIIYCPTCHEYFLDNTIPEPYINYHLNKLEAYIISIVDVCLFTFGVSALFSFPLWMWAIATAVLIPLWLKFKPYHKSKKYIASKHRIERNPEYLQCLADMGYLHEMAPEFRKKTISYGTSVQSDLEHCDTKSSSKESQTRRYIRSIKPDENRNDLISILTPKLIVVLLLLIACLFRWAPL